MKKLRKSLILILVLLITQSIFAQGWEKYYAAPVDSFRAVSLSVSQTINGDIAILNEGYDHILEIDGDGTPNWIPITDVGGFNYDGFSGFPREIFRKDNLIATNDGKFVTVDDGRGLFSIYNLSSTGDIDIAKYEPNGDTVWTKKHSTSYTLVVATTLQLNDNNLLIALYEASYTTYKIKLIKINYTDGTIIWTKDIIGNIGNYLAFRDDIKIIENDDGTLMLYSKDENIQSNIALRKLDNLGNTIWKKSFSSRIRYIPFYQGAFAKTQDDGFVFLVEEPIPQTFFLETKLVKTDSLGNEEWRTTVNQDYVGELLVTSDNDVLVVGTRNDAVNNKKLPIISKYKINGTLDWEKTKGHSNNHPFLNFQHVVELDNNNFVGIGITDTTLFNIKEIYIVSFDSLGRSYTNQINGNVYSDQNLDCSQNNGETNIAGNVLLQLIQGTDTFFHITDTLGNFAVDVNTGTYEISAIPLSPYWQTCPSQTVAFINPFDTSTISLGLQPIIACSDVSVNISTPKLVRCFPNTYYVNYGNLGTVAEPNAYIEVVLDPFFIFDAATIPYTQNGNIYTFQIGNLDVYEYGSFEINFTVDCNATVLGQSHCTEANIYPQQICTPTGVWNGATIVADAQCTGNNTVELKVENVGLAAMTQNRQYWIIEDQVLLQQGTFNLQPGQDSTWTIPATPGAIYRIEAEQEITHPWGNNLPSAITFNCNGSNTPLNSLINQFGLDDYVNFVDIDCQQNVGSYDPNDKQGFPIGYGQEHFITKDDKIEYLIRFQNTGTYTAFDVVVEDEIDIEALDLTTLQIQGSSHPYTLSIRNGNILRFDFANINLPDSTTNEPASHGFIKFKISQKANNSIGRVIKNSAAIYFDFNAPIITNTTFHTVGEDFIQIVSTHQQREKLAEVRVFPNPFTQQARFEIITDKEYKEIQLMVFDVVGRMVKTLNSDYMNQLILDREGLNTGVYFYKIMGDGQVLDSGKLMVR